VIKTVYLDTETTGTDPGKHGIIQLAVIVEIDGKVEARQSWNIKPFADDVIEDKALEVNKHTHEEIMAYHEPERVFFLIDDFLGRFVDRYKKNKTREDKFYPAGYNVDFDMRMLAAFWKKNRNYYFGSYFNGMTIDPLYLFRWFAWQNRIELPDHRLETMCGFLGIELAGAHDALADITATRELIIKLAGMVKLEMIADSCGSEKLGEECH
jgi:DNA polymerase-3 subunit epsilon